MKKDVLISVKSFNLLSEDNKDEIEFMTKGDYYKKDEKCYIKYQEMSEIGLPDTTTTLKIEDKKVTITRFGKNNSQLILERGKKHIGHYETPYGAFTVGVIPNFIDIDINEKGGKLCLKYEVEFNDIPTSKNCINLSFREG